MNSGRLWTANEVSQAIELYCITPFGRMHSRNPEIIGLAEKLGRTPSSVAMKLTNLAALDETLPRKGMSNYSKLDAEVWHNFFAIAPERVQPFSGFADKETTFDYENAVGENVAVTAKARRGQGLFRETILTIYDRRCALTGVSNPELLIASHIVPWAEDKAGRIDPTNGLCLNALFDKAFDRGLITFDEEYRLVASAKLTLDSRKHISEWVGKPLAMPDRFLPSQKHLDWHRNNRFGG